jgi:hypothetical protein
MTTGIEALNRSQASAEAETGSIDSPVKECLAWIGVAARYDDPWATPVTGRHVRIKVEGGIVADGPRTKGLSTYGKEDGQPHDDVREELGCYRQNGVKKGSAVITLVPDGNDDPKGIEKQILSNLSAFETSMRQRLQPWITEWSKDGWLSVPEAKRRGQLRGLGTWWEGEVEFWASVGDVAKEVWDGIKSGASKLAAWYEDLPWYEKSFPPLAIGHELVNWLIETAQTLWDRRDQLMQLLKAFYAGTAAAIEKALEALIDLPGDLGKLFKELVQHSAEWVQNMIEVARETDVFKNAAKTIMTVVMMMTPNFWAEGIGMVEGYLLPEVLITIVLIIIGALCAAAGASALAARITGFLSKLRKAIGAAGKAGEVLTTLFSKLDELAELIGNLSKALRRKIDEVIEGATEKINKLVRRSAKRTSAVLDESMRHAKLAEQRTAQRLTDHPNFDGRTFKGVPGKDPGYDWVDDLGRKYDALGDGTKSQYMKLDQFTKSIDHHLLKGNDFTIIDMTGYTTDQISAVKQYVDALPAAKQAMIIRVGF